MIIRRFIIDAFMTFIRQINVDATSRMRRDVHVTLYKCHVPTGQNLSFMFYFVNIEIHVIRAAHDKTYKTCVTSKD